MATNAELRAQVVAIGKSREGKNQYTQGSKRTQVGSGWSDCSSFVRWCYLQILGIDIGLNTVEQITNKKLLTIHSGGKKPFESDLLPGDIILFKGTDASRPKKVGHVEMYIGGGKIIGHGSGIGPKIRNLTDYCNTRYNNGTGYIETRRIIGSAAYPGGDLVEKLGDRPLYEGMYKSKMVKQWQELLIALNYGSHLGSDGADGDYGPKTATATKWFQYENLLATTGTADVVTIKAAQALATGGQPEIQQHIRIAGGQCYVRTKASSSSKDVGVVKSGTVLDASGEAETGWNGILYTVDGVIGKYFVSTKYSEVVK